MSSQDTFDLASFRDNVLVTIWPLMRDLEQKSDVSLHIIVLHIFLDGSGIGMDYGRGVFCSEVGQVDVGSGGPKKYQN